MLKRRDFLAYLAATIAGIRARLPLQFPRTERLPIAFSTLGCPDWDWLTILDFAAAHGFAAIELRGLLDSMDLTARPEFGRTQIEETRKQLAERDLRVAGLGSSAHMHEPDPAKREAQLGEARRFIDLAHALEAPYVRVFGDRYVAAEAREVTINRIARGLRELGEYARAKNVTVLLESHGDFTDSPTLLAILERADSPGVALLWDAHHTFAFSNETPEDTVRQLGKYIRHTHLKDSVADGEGRRYVLTGAGEVPVVEQVEQLAASGYRGLYCFEWEKRWHPDIEEPEIAFAHYGRVIRQYLRADA